MDAKVFSMPRVPSGDKGIVEILKEILNEVNKNTSPTKILKFTGSSSQNTLNELCVNLRPMNLVVKTEYGWALTKESKKYLESDDKLYLAALLCANIKFVGEILFYLENRDGFRP